MWRPTLGPADGPVNIPLTGKNSTSFYRLLSLFSSRMRVLFFCEEDGSPPKRGGVLMQRVSRTRVNPLVVVLGVLAAVAVLAVPLVVRVSAQGGGGGGGVVDITGEWAGNFQEEQPERLAGPELGDYLGLPVNEAARLHADTWDASRLTLPEEQCMPHPST